MGGALVGISAVSRHQAGKKSGVIGQLKVTCPDRKSVV